MPLVIALHGSDHRNPLAMQGLSHLAQVADQHGFIVAFLGSSDIAASMESAVGPDVPMPVG